MDKTLNNELKRIVAIAFVISLLSSLTFLSMTWGVKHLKQYIVESGPVLSKGMAEKLGNGVNGLVFMNWRNDERRYVLKLIVKGSGAQKVTNEVALDAFNDVVFNNNKFLWVYSKVNKPEVKVNWN